MRFHFLEDSSNFYCTTDAKGAYRTFVYLWRAIPVREISRHYLFMMFEICRIRLYTIHFSMVGRLRFQRHQSQMTVPLLVAKRYLLH